jgi:SAM-dependent methyltransferase
MDPKGMEPHGMAMSAFFDGDTNAELSVRRDDGLEDTIPVSRFFRDPSEFTPIENAALDLCRGPVLDVGAGSGLHSLVLQEKGVPVTSIDIIPHAVEIMKQRGVKDAHCANIFEFQGGPYNTILLLGRGIGMVETIAGLDRFLAHAEGLVFADGLVLLDSLDVRVTDDPSHLAYHEANRKAGRYVGESRLQFHFQGKKGANCCWLHVDSDTLKERAEAASWLCDVILQEETGDYLAKLTR